MSDNYIPPTWIPTGCPEIDHMLGGGVKVGVVTEICGEHGIGKSQFCMQLVLSGLTWLANRGVSANAIYLASNMAFPPRRLQEICSRFTRDYSVLRDVLIRDVDTADEIPEALNDIRDMLVQNANSLKKTHILVFDSISAIFSKPSASVEELRDRTVRVRNIGFAMERLASTYNIAIVVCNKVVNNFDPNYEHNFHTSARLVKPAVGKAWERSVHARLVMAWDDMEDATQVRVVYREKGMEGNGAKRGFAVTTLGIEIVPEPPSTSLN